MATNDHLQVEHWFFSTKSIYLWIKHVIIILETQPDGISSLTPHANPWQYLGWHPMTVIKVGRAYTRAMRATSQHKTVFIWETQGVSIHEDDNLSFWRMNQKSLAHHRGKEEHCFVHLRTTYSNGMWFKRWWWWFFESVERVGNFFPPKPGLLQYCPN